MYMYSAISIIFAKGYRNAGFGDDLYVVYIFFRQVAAVSSFQAKLIETLEGFITDRWSMIDKVEFDPYLSNFNVILHN